MPTEATIMRSSLDDSPTTLVSLPVLQFSAGCWPTRNSKVGEIWSVLWSMVLIWLCPTTEQAANEANYRSQVSCTI